MWLKQNNRYYFNITISDENMALLPEDGDASAFLPSFFDASEGESENQDPLENEVLLSFYLKSDLINEISLFCIY